MNNMSFKDNSDHFNMIGTREIEGLMLLLVRKKFVFSERK